MHLKGKDDCHMEKWCVWMILRERSHVSRLALVAVDGLTLVNSKLTDNFVGCCFTAIRTNGQIGLVIGSFHY